MLKLALSFLAIASVTGCATGDLEPDSDLLRAETRPSDEPASITAVDDRGPPPRTRPQDGTLAPECQGLQEAATTVLGTYQQCSVDADCGTSWVNAMCLGSFLCPVAVNTKADLKRLQREASALSFGYRRACTTNCPVASCAAPARTYCDQATRRCKSSF